MNNSLIMNTGVIDASMNWGVATYMIGLSYTPVRSVSYVLCIYHVARLVTVLIYVHCACVEYHLISIYIVVYLFYIRVVIVCSGLILTSVLQPAGILQYPRTLSGWTEVHEVL